MNYLKIRNRHRHLLLMSLILCIFSGLAQENGDVQNLYKTELDKMVKVPASPEAQAFMKYGDTKVSLYSGVPQINIPLHSFEGIEFNLPLTLTYDASGIKVEQLATWVGLGWNLNVGGRITRMANGLPDDYIQGDYTTINNVEVVDNIIKYRDNSSTFSSTLEAQEYFDFLLDISKNHVDAEPDYYMLNAPGISATIVQDIEDNNQLKALNNPRISIERYTNGWRITNEDGTVYEFLDESETTLKNGNDELPNGAVISEYESSWMLTKITSPNGKDIYEFNYTDFGYWAQEQLGSSASRVVNNFVDSPYLYPEPTPQYGSVAGYWVKQQFLTSIAHNGITLMTSNLGVRHDIDDNGNNTRLGSLDFFDLEGNDFKSIEFDNSHYFNRSNLNLADENPFDIRLKLDGIVINGKLNGVYQNYAFEYQNPDDLPSRSSYKQDYFGYYNGQNNSSLIPRYETGDHIFPGANREPDAAYGKIGMLTRITYPTKGYTDFEYESHDVYKTETTQSTATYLDVGLTGSSVTDGNLYYNDSGQACDDRFLDYDLPKILFKVFTIPETGSYDLQYTSSTGETEGYIMYLGTIDESTCKTGPLGNIICSSPNDIYDNYCDVYLSSGAAHWISTSNNTGPVDFDAGVYKVMIVLDEDSPGNYGTVDLQITREESAISSGNYDVGGIRIKEIRDFSGQGELARTKFYSYRDDEGKSTGQINFQPVLSTVKSFNTSSNSVTQLIRTATFPKGDEPYVVYPSVKEYLLDDQGNSEGYTIHSFHKDARGAVPRTTLPFENSYYGSLKATQPVQTIQVDTHGDIVAKQNVDFYETSTGHVSMNGWVYYTEEGNSDKRIAIKKYTPQVGPDYYTYEYLQNFECTGTNFCQIPGYIQDPQAYGYETLLDGKYSALKGRFSFTAGAYGGVSSVVDSLYLKDANGNPLELVTVKETTYDPAVDYLPRTTRTTDSEGEVFETTNYYAKDNIVTGSSNLITNNKLAEVVKSETFRDPDDLVPVKIQSSEKEYSNVNGLPTLVKTQKAESNVHDRVAFSYHGSGNLKEANIINGAITTYVWGYGDRYPVAVVNNATQSDIDAVTLNMTLINNPATQDGAMRTELDKLRTNLGNAMVTTYTYDPLVGVTSITDPRGYATFYEYDEYNRLINIKDEDGKMVQEYEYGYRTDNYTNPDAPSSYPPLGGTMIGPESVQHGSTFTYIISPSGGSEDYAYTWYQDGNLVQTGGSSIDITFNNGDSTIRVDILDNITSSTTSITKDVVITYDPLSVASLTSSVDQIITGSQITFNAPTVSGGSTSKTYEWLVDGAVVSNSSGNLTYSQFNTAKVYTVIYRVNDLTLGTLDESSMDVTAHAPLNDHTITGDNIHLTVGDSYNFTSSNIGGGSGTRTFEWYIKQDSGSFVLQSHTAQSNFYPNFGSAGVYTIKLVVMDATVITHSKEDTSVVNVHAPISIANSDITTPSPVTVETSTYFNINTASGGSGNFSYEWDVTNQDTSYNFGVGTFSEANRNVASFTMGYEFYGNNTRIQCRVHDNLTGEYTTVYKDVVVNGGTPLSISSIATQLLVDQTDYKTYRVTATASGGSGNFTYKWTMDGQVVQDGASNSYESVAVSCGTDESDTVRVDATDTLTGNTVSQVRTITITGCSSGGNQ